MIRAGVYVALTAVAAVVQVTWLSGFHPGGGGVDLLLLVVMSVGLLHGPEEGTLIGAGGGLLQDVVNGVPIGLGLGANLCAGFCAGIGEGRLYLEDIWLPALAGFALTLVRNAVWIGIGHLAGVVSVAPLAVARVVVLSACYNGVVAMPVFYWFRRMDRALERTFMRAR